MLSERIVVGEAAGMRIRKPLNNYNFYEEQ
jgi:hypothetical protein